MFLTNIGHKYMDIEHDKRTYLFRKSLQLTYHCQRMTSWFPVKIVALSAGGQFVSPSTFSPMNSIFECTNFFIPAENELIHVTQINFVQVIFRLRLLIRVQQIQSRLLKFSYRWQISQNFYKSSSTFSGSRLPSKPLVCQHPIVILWTPFHTMFKLYIINTTL